MSEQSPALQHEPAAFALLPRHSSPRSGSTTRSARRSAVLCQHCGEPAPEGAQRSKTHRKLTELEADAIRHHGQARTFRGHPVRAGLLLCWPCKNSARHNGVLRDVMGRQILRDMAVTLVEAGFKKAQIARALGIGRRTLYDYIGDVWREK